MYSYSGLWKGQGWISFSYFNTLAEFKNQQPISKVGDHNYSDILEELPTQKYWVNLCKLKSNAF